MYHVKCCGVRFATCCTTINTDMMNIQVQLLFNVEVSYDNNMKDIQMHPTRGWRAGKALRSNAA